jgi:hypothetical protein
MPKTVTYATDAVFHLRCNASGPRAGHITLEASNGASESVTIGPGPSFDVPFATLGTAGERNGFVAIVAAAIAAARTKIGDV